MTARGFDLRWQLAEREAAAGQQEQRIVAKSTRAAPLEGDFSIHPAIHDQGSIVRYARHGAAIVCRPLLASPVPQEMEQAVVVRLILVRALPTMVGGEAPRPNTRTAGVSYLSTRRHAACQRPSS